MNQNLDQPKPEARKSYLFELALVGLTLPLAYAATDIHAKIATANSEFVKDLEGKSVDYRLQKLQPIFNKLTYPESEKSGSFLFTDHANLIRDSLLKESEFAAIFKMTYPNLKITAIDYESREEYPIGSNVVRFITE